MDEIKDTVTDREALRVLLTRFRDTDGVDTKTASVGLLNETWARMARVLAAMDEETFNGVVNWVAQQQEAVLPTPEDVARGRRWPERELRLAGIGRAEELLGLIVEWRAETWEASEIAAGRDPYVRNKGWTPPRGWTPPARR